MPAPEDLAFERKANDDFFDRTCNDPTCPNCNYRHAMRKLLGTLVEAVQTAAVAQKAAIGIWGECPDPECDFEQRMLNSIEEGATRIISAYVAFHQAVALWQTLPVTWDHEEMEAINTAIGVVQQQIAESTLPTNGRPN